MKKVLKFIFLLIFLLLNSCGGGGSSEPNGAGEGINTSQCGTIGLNSKIVNGSECVNKNSQITTISIAPNNDFVDVCTGTLITANAVLTAAHCLINNPEATFIIHEGKQYSAKRIIIHPGYSVNDSQNLVFNDVGIIVPSTPIPASTLPIIVSKAPAVAEKISIYGFGLNDAGVHGELRSGQMEIDSVSGSHLRATYLTDSSSTCGGDSGGPAVQIAFNERGDKIPGILGVLSTGSDRFCRIGDVSSFVILNNPSVLGFILDNVPNVGLI